MRYLFDTCAFIDAITDEHDLDADIIAIMDDWENALAEEHFRTYAKLLPNEVEDHKDPSDHLIISHAITNRIPLISRDRKFRFYENQGLDLIYYGRK